MYLIPKNVSLTSLLLLFDFCKYVVSLPLTLSHLYLYVGFLITKFLSKSFVFVFSTLSNSKNSLSCNEQYLRYYLL